MGDRGLQSAGLTGQNKFGSVTHTGADRQDIARSAEWTGRKREPVRPRNDSLLFLFPCLALEATGTDVFGDCDRCRELL